MSIKISIIVPVYNAEENIRQCIDSICAQTIDKSEIELLLVDDKSTDSSFEICKEYEKEHDYIKVIQLPNNSGGASAPRNEGVRISSGEYVFFVDSDDWIGRDALRLLLMHAEESDADFVWGRVIRVNRLERKPFTSWMRKNDEVIHTCDEFSKERALTESLACWGRLVKKDLLTENDITFPEDVFYYEDYAWSIQVLHHAQKAILANDYDYYFFRRDEGVVSIVSNMGMGFQKRPENQYKSVDRAFSIAEKFGFSPDHLVWSKLFSGPVRFSIEHIDEYTINDPDNYPDCGLAYKEMIWKRVNKHYDEHVRSNIPVKATVGFDAIASGLGFKKIVHPIQYYLKKMPKKENLQIASDNIIKGVTISDNILDFLSDEARIRLVAIQAASYHFYGNLIDMHDGIMHGEYFTSLKVIDGFTFTIQAENSPIIEEIEIMPEIWGESYQEKGRWKAKVDADRVKKIGNFNICIRLQGKTILETKILPWDTATNKPEKAIEYRLRKSQEHLDRSKEQLKHSREQLKRSREKLKRIIHSRSWRITRPLRQVSSIISRSRKTDDCDM